MAGLTRLNKSSFLTNLNIAVIFSIPWLLFLPKGNGILELIIFLGGPLYIYYHRKQWLNQSQPARFLLFLVGLFTLSAWFSLIITEGFLTGTNTFRSKILKFFLLFSAVGLILTKNEYDKYFAYGFLSITLFATTCGYLYLIDIHLFEPHPYRPSHPAREFFQGFGQVKNQFAFFLNFYTWILVGYTLFTNYLQKKYVYPIAILTILASSAGLWLSGDRGAQITWLAALFFFTGVLLFTRARFKPLVYVILSIFILTGLFSTIYFLELPGHKIAKNNVKRLTDFQEYTEWSGRLTNIFPLYFLTIKDNSPWFGVGKENIRQKYEETVERHRESLQKHPFFGPIGKNFKSSHNIFLRTWAFYGFIPVLTLVAILIYVFVCIFKTSPAISLMGVPLICLVFVNGLVEQLDIYMISIALAYIWTQLNTFTAGKESG